MLKSMFDQKEWQAVFAIRETLIISFRLNARKQKKNNFWHKIERAKGATFDIGKIEQKGKRR